MTKIMAQLDDNGIIDNVIVAKPSTADTDNLVSVPDGQNAFIGGHIFEGLFYPAQPYDSWVRDNGQWVAPVQSPGGLCIWDEGLGEWVKPESPFASWVWDETTCQWDSPIPYPADEGMYIWDEDAGDWVATDATL